MCGCVFGRDLHMPNVGASRLLKKQTLAACVQRIRDLYTDVKSIGLAARIAFACVCEGVSSVPLSLLLCWLAAFPRATHPGDKETRLVCVFG